MHKARSRYTALLRPLREAANLTQPDLADDVGVSVRSIQKWEHGIVFPSARHRRKLERIFPELAGILAGAINHRARRTRARAAKIVTEDVNQAAPILAMSGLYGCLACELDMVPWFMTGLF